MEPPRSYTTVCGNVPEPSTVTWLIKNFDAICPERCDTFGVIESPQIQVPHSDGSSSVWYLWLGAERKYMKFYLILKSSNARGFEKSGVSCQFKLWVGPSVGPYICTRVDYDRVTFTSTDKQWGWKELTSVTHLYETKQQCWPNGVLRLYLELHVNERFPAPPGSSVTLESDALNMLLAHPTKSDVTIKCGSESFYAHKMILARSSPVFREIFLTKKEHFPTVVEVDDVDARDMRVILNSIYTARVEGVDPDSWLAIIKAAEKYGLKPLKDVCFTKVLDCLRKDTVGSLVVAAHVYNADIVTANRLKEYVVSNYYILMKDSNFKMLVSLYPEAFF